MLLSHILITLGWYLTLFITLPFLVLITLLLITRKARQKITGEHKPRQ